MIYEKKFWTHGDEFYDSNDNPYEGYVGVKDGKAYKFPNDEALTNRHTYLSNFRLSNMFFDRLLDDELELPYNKHQVTFAVNDFLNKGTLRTIIKRLHLNNHYLFKCATVSSPILPDTRAIKTLCTASGTPGLLERVDFESIMNNPSNSEAVRTAQDNTFFSTELKQADFDLFNLTCSTMTITGVAEVNKKKVLRLLIVLGFKDKIAFIRTLHTVDNSFLADDIGFGNTINFSVNNLTDKRNEIQSKINPEVITEEGLSDEPTTGNYDVVVLNRVEPLNKNSVRFINIADVCLNGDNLYVVDSKLNSLYKYDISQLSQNTTNTQWGTKSIQLMDSIQGSEINPSVFFKNPSAVAVSNDSVYLADKGNHLIKKYTKSLDFVKTLKCGKFAMQDIQSIVTNENSFQLENGTVVKEGSLWVLSKTTNHAYITIISDDKVVLTRQIHGITLEDKTLEEDIIDIQFSPSDSNYYYIVTNKRVFKLHTSRPTIPFGTMDIFNQSKIVANTVWRKATFRWGGQYTSIWGQTPDDYLNMKKSLINKCFCVCGCDSNLKKQFNGDVIFNIILQYSITKINSILKEHEEYKNFDALPTYLKAQTITTPYIMLFTDTHNYLQLLSDVDFLCYDNDDVTEINDTEYIDTLTINKCLYKVAYNLINFKNLLNGRFWGYYTDNHLMTYDRIVQDTVFKNLKADNNNDSKNLFVHTNEPNTIIINRTFECLWNIQNQICRFLNVVEKTASTTDSQVHTIIE